MSREAEGKLKEVKDGEESEGKVMSWRRYRQRRAGEVIELRQEDDASVILIPHPSSEASQPPGVLTAR